MKTTKIKIESVKVGKSHTSYRFRRKIGVEIFIVRN